MPFFFEAANLYRMRSPVISRSNCANDRSTLSVRRPIEVVVLNACVTDTNDAFWASNISTILAKVEQRSGQAVDLVNDNHVDLAGLDIAKQRLQRRSVHRSAGKAAIVVERRNDRPALVALTLDIGLTGFTLCIKRVERLLEPLLR